MERNMDTGGAEPDGATSLPGTIRPVVWLLFLGFLVAFGAEPARADGGADGGAGGFSEEEISFRGSGVTLRGTVLVPDGASPKDRPGIVLVHGAGPETREDRRDEAEAFAREGIVTLVYDKRTEGYSLFERSYGLLADDAIAAVGALRSHPEVDADAVGLWGLSEGAWVAPIAASRSDEVDFLVLVAATGVPPAQQQAWYLENQLRRQGVSGSMVGAVSRTGMRVLAGTGWFPEADHDPVGPLEGVRQPVLALWGEKDRIEPAAQSANILRDALRRGGNTHLAIRFFPDAEHGLRRSPDGFVEGERLAAGYAETVGSWAKGVADGETPGPTVAGPDPEQARPSRPLATLAWWESGWAQLGAVAVPVLAFGSCLAVAVAAPLARLALKRPRLAQKPATLRARRLGRWLAGTGLAVVLGSVGYFQYLTITEAGAVGPVVVGRPLPWLALQMLAVATSVLAVLAAASWWTARAGVGRAERTLGVVLLAGGAVFVTWAAYWGLLVP